MIDLIGQNGQVQGAVAHHLTANGQLNAGAMRPFIDSKGNSCITVYTGGDKNSPSSYQTRVINTNATLRRDEWKQLDQAIMDTAKFRLGGIDDLVAKGLVYNLGNAMGTTVLEWHDVSDGMEAVMSMDAVTRGNGDRPVFQHNYLPIPIVHVDYEIGARVLAASRSLGNPLDTTSVELATRKVKEYLESMLFTDTDYAFGELDSRSKNKIYSYLNHPDRNEVSLTTAWDDSSITGALIVADVLAMKQASIEAYHYGPWMLYIPTGYETVLDEDYSTAKGSNTIRERVMKIAGIQDIKVIDTLTADNVLLVQMTPDVVRLIKGMPIQNVEWGVEGNMITKYKVMTIQVPQIRSDQNLRSGVTHMA